MTEVAADDNGAVVPIFGISRVASIGEEPLQVITQQEKYRVKFSITDRQFRAEVAHHFKACRLASRTALPKVVIRSAQSRFFLTDVGFILCFSIRQWSQFLHLAKMGEPPVLADPKTRPASKGLLA